MALTITSLRVDSRKTEGWFDGGTVACPYLICNVTFQITPDEDGNWSFERAKAEAEEYRQVLTIDDPKRYEDWLLNQWGFDQFRYDGYGRSWTHQDCPWRYIEKFDTFWFREWIADCGPTRTIISELEYYKEHGKLPSVYRTMESEIILQHLRTLQGYWD